MNAAHDVANDLTKDRGSELMTLARIPQHAIIERILVGLQNSEFDPITVELADGRRVRINARPQPGERRTRSDASPLAGDVRQLNAGAASALRSVA